MTPSDRTGNILPNDGTGTPPAFSSRFEPSPLRFGLSGSRRATTLSSPMRTERSPFRPEVKTLAIELLPGPLAASVELFVFDVRSWTTVAERFVGVCGSSVTGCVEAALCVGLAVGQACRRISVPSLKVTPAPFPFTTSIACRVVASSVWELPLVLLTGTRAFLVAPLPLRNQNDKMPVTATTRNRIAPTIRLFHLPATFDPRSLSPSLFLP